MSHITSRKLAYFLLALTISAQACSNGNSDDSDSTPSSSSTPSDSLPASTEPEREEAKNSTDKPASHTTPGTKLQINETATLPRFTDNDTNILATVTEISQLDSDQVPDAEEGKSYYVLRTTIELQTTKRISLVQSPALRDSTGVLGRTIGETDNCESDFPDGPYVPGDKYEFCEIARFDEGAEGIVASWFQHSDYAENPVTWSAS